MGTKRSSLVDFRDKAARYKEFRIVFDSVFSPANIDIRFNRVVVCNSASPYIAFVGEGVEVTLSHIREVRFSNMVYPTYMFVCNDYSSSNTPVQVQYKKLYSQREKTVVKKRHERKRTRDVPERLDR